MKVLQKLFMTLALMISLSAWGRGLDWQGDWKLTVKKFQNLSIPIIGNTNEMTKELNLKFQTDLGLIYVTITDKNGNTVYQEPVQTKEIPNLSISLKDLELEQGTISITDGENLIYGVIIF